MINVWCFSEQVRVPKFGTERMGGETMKKNMEQLTLWMKLHKKKVAACMAVILLALGALGIGLAGMQKENQKTVIAKADQKKKVDEKQTKKTDLKEEKTSKDDSKKESEIKDAVKETTEVKTEEKQKASQPDTSAPAQKNDAFQTTGGSNAGNSGNGGNQNAAPVHTHNYNIPLYAQQWVVDQAAWTETVSEPVYEMVEHTICSTCQADISGFAGQHLDETMHGGYYSDWRQEQTGTNTYTVPHPEQGHYESVVTGHQCSCGAVQ